MNNSKTDKRGKPGGGLAQKLKSRLDRAFLRPQIKGTFKAVGSLERELKGASALLSGKIDALAAKLKAQDAVNAELAKQLRTIDQKLGPRAVATNKPQGLPIEPSASGQKTVLVELMGPSGVGKSTILRAALDLRSSGQEWFGPHDIEANVTITGSRMQELRDALDHFEPREFVPRCLNIIEASTMVPSQKVSAMVQLRETCREAIATRAVSSSHPLVHDELLMHRASTLLLYSEDYENQAAWYFDTVPTPDAVAIIHAKVGTILKRVKERSNNRVNTHYNLDDNALRDVIQRSLRENEIAAERLRARGVIVIDIDAERPVQEQAKRLHSFICSLGKQGTIVNALGEQSPEVRNLKARLRSSSGSFRKKDGRHKLQHENIIYCAFKTNRIKVDRHEAQRSAPERLVRFGIKESDVKGKSVLDLGCHNGAMLLELSNFNPVKGVGVEYDADKVALARDIASYSELSNLQFEQGDIDKIDPEALGVFDIVFALAIETHVTDAERLYEVLGKVTGQALYFEGNGGCDIDDTERRLLANGFKTVEHIGFCDDDIVSSNNRRPLMVARK